MTRRAATGKLERKRSKFIYARCSRIARLERGAKLGRCASQNRENTTGELNKQPGAFSSKVSRQAEGTTAIDADPATRPKCWRWCSSLTTHGTGGPLLCKLSQRSSIAHTHACTHTHGASRMREREIASVLVGVTVAAGAACKLSLLYKHSV